MSVALLMLSLIAAVAAGVAVWTAAGFWWALIAYAGTGAATLLLLGVLVAMLPSSEGRQPSHLAKPEGAS